MHVWKLGSMLWMHGASKSIRTVSGRIPGSFLTFVAPPRKQITCHLFCFCSSCLPLLVLSPRAHGLISYSGTYFSTCSTLTTLFVPQRHYGVQQIPPVIAQTLSFPSSAHYFITLVMQNTVAFVMTEISSRVLVKALCSNNSRPF